MSCAAIYCGNGPFCPGPSAAGSSGKRMCLQLLFRSLSLAETVHLGSSPRLQNSGALCTCNAFKSHWKQCPFSTVFFNIFPVCTPHPKLRWTLAWRSSSFHALCPSLPPYLPPSLALSLPPCPPCLSLLCSISCTHKALRPPTPSLHDVRIHSMSSPPTVSCHMHDLECGCDASPSPISCMGYLHTLFLSSRVLETG